MHRNVQAIAQSRRCRDADPESGERPWTEPDHDRVEVIDGVPGLSESGLGQRYESLGVCVRVGHGLLGQQFRRLRDACGITMDHRRCEFMGSQQSHDAGGDRRCRGIQGKHEHEKPFYGARAETRTASIGYSLALPRHRRPIGSVGRLTRRAAARRLTVSEQVTLADVARWAGVSLATASRALHGSTGRTVGPEMRARVRAAAAELNYSPNANAQAIVRGTTTTVGLIVHDIGDPSAAALASGVIAGAADRDLIVTIASTLSDPFVEIRHVEALRSQRAKAVILAGSRFNDAESSERLAEELLGFSVGGGHVAVIGQHTLPLNTIVIDNAGGAARLARALISLGYRRFAVLAGPGSLITSEDRVAGFRQAVVDAGLELPEENIIETQFTRDGGYVAMTELLDREIEVEAVFAVNDVMAVGATAALRDQGFQVPRDMAVAGFDDIPTLRDVRPALTTVRLPLVEIGRRALELALGGPGVSVDGAAGDPILVAVPGEVVVRDSTPRRT